MKKEKNPAILFYYSNFQHTVRRWSNAEVGEYILMLCEQADSATGGIDPEIFESECTTKKIQSKFEKDDTGYFNPKLRGVIIKRENFIEKQREKVAKRWGKDTGENAVASTMVLPNDGKTIIEIEKEVEKKESEPIKFPFTDEDFIRWWNIWKEYKKDEHRFKFKTTKSEQIALNKLARESGNSAFMACKMIEHSIGCGYQGIFPLKGSGNNQPETSNRPSRKKL